MLSHFDRIIAIYDTWPGNEVAYSTMLLSPHRTLQQVTYEKHCLLGKCMWL